MAREISREQLDKYWDQYVSRYNAVKNKVGEDAMKPMYRSKGELKNELISIRRLDENAGYIDEDRRAEIRTKKHNAIRELVNDQRVTTARQERAFSRAREKVIELELKKSNESREDIRERILQKYEDQGKKIPSERTIARQVNKEISKRLEGKLTIDGKASIAYDALSMSSKEFKERLIKDVEFKRDFAKGAAVIVETTTLSGRTSRSRSLRPYFYPEEYTRKGGKYVRK